MDNRPLFNGGPEWLTLDRFLLIILCLMVGYCFYTVVEMQWKLAEAKRVFENVGK